MFKIFKNRKNMALLDAIVADDLKKIRKLLDKGADVNGKDDDEDIALILASRRGHTQILKALLEAGADVNAKNYHGDTALCSASDYGHTQIVKALLEAGADVNAKNGYKNTALSLASNEGYREIVKALLEAGADVNVKNLDGDTALIQASDEGHTQIVKALIKARANVNAKGEDGDTALIRASFRGHTEVVKVLIKAGADVNAKGEDGDTALIQASDNGYTEIVKTLLDAGAIGEPKGVTKMSVTSLAAEFQELLPQYVFEVTGEQLSAGQPVNQEEVARISVNRAGEVLMRKYGLSAAEVAKVVELSASTVPDDQEMLDMLRSLCEAYAANDTAEIARLEPLATQIGVELNRRGSLREMQRVFELLGGRRGSRTLEMHWGGIGDWRG